MQEIDASLYDWYKIFESAEVAKDKVPLRKLQQIIVGGKTLCFAHTPNGFFALEDVCPHLGYSLSKGTTNYLNEVICPWHSYRYNLDTGRECEFRTKNALLYPVDVREEGIYIGIRNSANS
jgi:nitrite reductase/ring-hydroxylating ferredoxin subunit